MFCQGFGPGSLWMQCFLDPRIGKKWSDEWVTHVVDGVGVHEVRHCCAHEVYVKMIWANGTILLLFTRSPRRDKLSCSCIPNLTSDCMGHWLRNYSKHFSLNIYVMDLLFSYPLVCCGLGRKWRFWYTPVPPKPVCGGWSAGCLAGRLAGRHRGAHGIFSCISRKFVSCDCSFSNDIHIYIYIYIYICIYLFPHLLEWGC